MNLQTAHSRELHHRANWQCINSPVARNNEVINARGKIQVYFGISSFELLISQWLEKHSDCHAIANELVHESDVWKWYAITATFFVAPWSMCIFG